jgi:F-type H+-transporting ATPase subunit b
MRKHLNKIIGFAVSACSLLLVSALWAAEEGHGGHEDLGSQLLVLAFFTINFLLFALLLRRYALPVVRDALRQRRETVVQALNEAKRAREEAETLRLEYEQRLAGLTAERERLQAEALEAAEREKEKTLNEARRMVDRIQTEAHMVAQREIEEARRLLRQEVAEQAVRIATEMIRSQLTGTDRHRFVQDLALEVTNARNESR